MSDSESKNSIQSRCFDDELEHLGQSRANNESIKQPYTTVHTPSVEQSKTSVTSVTGGNIKHTLSLRSAHYQGNQGCHVTPEEAGSFKGEIFIETPNLASQNSLRNTPPSFTPQRSCIMGRGRGRTRLENTKISTGCQITCGCQNTVRVGVKINVDVKIRVGVLPLNQLMIYTTSLVSVYSITKPKNKLNIVVHHVKLFYT